MPSSFNASKFTRSNFSDITAQIADSAAAEYNVKRARRNDTRLVKLRSLLQKKVKYWDPKTKKELLVNYGGDASGMDYEYRGQALDNAVVDALITTMSPEDLEIVLSKLEVEQKKIRGEYTLADKRAMNLRRKTFAAGDFYDAYANLRNKRNPIKSLKKLGYNVNVPRKIRKLFTKLRSSLKTVLTKYFEADELYQFAEYLNISLDGAAGTKKKVIQEIIDKCILYVAMIKNKTKLVIDLSPEGVEAIRKILSYTPEGQAILGMKALDVSRIQAEIREKQQANRESELKLFTARKVRKAPKTIIGKFFSQRLGKNARNAKKFDKLYGPDGKDTTTYAYLNSVIDGLQSGTDPNARAKLDSIAMRVGIPDYQNFDDTGLIQAIKAGIMAQEKGARRAKFFNNLKFWDPKRKSNEKEINRALGENTSLARGELTNRNRNIQEQLRRSGQYDPVLDELSAAEDSVRAPMFTTPGYIDELNAYRVVIVGNDTAEDSESQVNNEYANAYNELQNTENQRIEQSSLFNALSKKTKRGRRKALAALGYDDESYQNLKGKKLKQARSNAYNSAMDAGGTVSTDMSTNSIYEKLLQNNKSLENNEVLKIKRKYNFGYGDTEKQLNEKLNSLENTDENKDERAAIQDDINKLKKFKNNEKESKSTKGRFLVSFKEDRSDFNEDLVSLRTYDTVLSKAYDEKANAQRVFVVNQLGDTNEKYIESQAQTQLNSAKEIANKYNIAESDMSDHNKVKESIKASAGSEEEANEAIGKFSKIVNTMKTLKARSQTDVSSSLGMTILTRFANRKKQKQNNDNEDDSNKPIYSLTNIKKYKKLLISDDDLNEVGNKLKQANKLSAKLDVGTSPTPVFLLNKQDIYKTKLDEISDNLQSLVDLTPGQQSVMGTNAMAGMTAVVTASNTVANTSEAAFKALLGQAHNGLSGRAISAFANGGLGSANKLMNSTFISGDSTDGKEHKEKVSIDWNNKTYSVKPVPTDGENVKAVSKQSSTSYKTASGQIRSLSQSERESPMAVSIVNNLINYKSSSISGADSSGTALKVYPVNNFITEKYDVGNTKASLLELVAAIKDQLVAINVGTQTQTQAGASSVQNQTSIAQILGGIATQVSAVVNQLKASSQTSTNQNPFTASNFPEIMNGILSGY